jgi:excisionase family DNA binding protein
LEVDVARENKNTATAAAWLEAKPQLRGLLTVPEVAEQLALAEKTIWTWVAARRISVVRLGRAVRINTSELQRLIEEGTTPAR